VLRHTLSFVRPAIRAGLLSFSLIFCVSACVTRAHHPLAVAHHYAYDRRSPESLSPATRININTATPNELETLPGIGKAMAARIIEHREKYGRFRRPEHLIIVRGISDRKFRALREFIAVD
jgi:competence ComEA-like helix-hairpin-helix protein